MLNGLRLAGVDGEIQNFDLSKKKFDSQKVSNFKSKSLSFKVFLTVLTLFGRLAMTHHRPSALV